MDLANINSLENETHVLIAKECRHDNHGSNHEKYGTKKHPDALGYVALVQIHLDV